MQLDRIQSHRIFTGRGLIDLRDFSGFKIAFDRSSDYTRVINDKKFHAIGISNRNSQNWPWVDKTFNKPPLFAISSQTATTPPPRPPSVVGRSIVVKPVSNRRSINCCGVQASIVVMLP